MAMFYENIYMEKPEEVTICLNSYMADKSLYLGLVDEDGYPYADITVCLAHNYPHIPPFHAFLDTNNLPDVTKFVEKYQLGKFTGKVGHSGFCTYPLYRFDPEKLKELCPNEFEEFFGRTYEAMKLIEVHIIERK